MIQKALTKTLEELTPQELASRKDFDCGEKSLNVYLEKQMSQHDRKNIAKTYFYILDGKIVGYYTISMSELNFINIYPDISKKKKLPAHPVPVILLARLAIDLQHQGKGYSNLIMGEMITKAFAISNSVGGVGIVVDALHQKAANYYIKYGFEPSPSNPLRLFMSLKK